MKNEKKNYVENCRRSRPSDGHVAFYRKRFTDHCAAAPGTAAAASAARSLY